jgi:hypothetical protein
MDKHDKHHKPKHGKSAPMKGKATAPDPTPGVVSKDDMGTTPPPMQDPRRTK